MPQTFTTLSAHRSPAAPPSRTWLPALVPSPCQEKGQAPGYSFLEKTPYRTPTTHNRVIRRDYALHPLCRPESARDHL